MRNDGDIHIQESNILVILHIHAEGVAWYYDSMYGQDVISREDYRIQWYLPDATTQSDWLMAQQIWVLQQSSPIAMIVGERKSDVFEFFQDWASLINRHYI